MPRWQRRGEWQEIPTGPEAPFDPAEPKEKKRVHSWGFLPLHRAVRSRYMIGTRGKGEVSSGSNHLGFPLCHGRKQFGAKQEEVMRLITSVKAWSVPKPMEV
jgi:hypothetical protein